MILDVQRRMTPREQHRMTPGVIADDYAGATDVSSSLVDDGLPVRLPDAQGFLITPTQACLDRPGDPAVAALTASEFAVARARRVPIRAVMAGRLSPKFRHDSPAPAMAMFEEFEEAERLWQMTDPTPASLTEAQIVELGGTFGARW